MNSDLSKLALVASLLLISKPKPRRSLTRGDSILFTITGPGGQDVILPETNIAITPGDTVLDASIKAFQEAGIPFEIAGFGKDAYILSIANITQYQDGPQSRWLYNIDGEYPAMSPAEYYLKADNRLEWIYTTDGGKDIGAPLVSFEQRNNNTLARR